jgi:hypothetical protein
MCTCVSTDTEMSNITQLAFRPLLSAASDEGEYHNISNEFDDCPQQTSARACPSQWPSESSFHDSTEAVIRGCVAITIFHHPSAKSSKHNTMTDRKQSTVQRCRVG